MRIYLTGFMGAGKTTVGRILSEQLAYPFFDLDQQIEFDTNKRIETIFRDSGESEFREIERITLQRLTADPAVIATGGGCFIYNEEWMLKNGIVVYLQTSLEVLARRVGADPSRPLWRNAKAIYEQRESHYKKAHIIVNAEAMPQLVAEQIGERLKSFTQENRATGKTPES